MSELESELEFQKDETKVEMAKYLGITGQRLSDLNMQIAAMTKAVLFEELGSDEIGDDRELFALYLLEKDSISETNNMERFSLREKIYFAYLMGIYEVAIQNNEDSVSKEIKNDYTRLLLADKEANKIGTVVMKCLTNGDIREKIDFIFNWEADINNTDMDSKEMDKIRFANLCGKSSALLNRESLGDMGEARAEYDKFIIKKHGRKALMRARSRGLDRKMSTGIKGMRGILNINDEKDKGKAQEFIRKMMIGEMVEMGIKDKEKREKEEKRKKAFGTNKLKMS